MNPFLYERASDARGVLQAGAGDLAVQPTGLPPRAAILGTSPACMAAHPSDMAVALAALDTPVRTLGLAGERTIPLADLHRLPGDNRAAGAFDVLVTGESELEFHLEKTMTTAIIGVGNLGSALARHLVDGGETVVLAARDGAHSAGLAHELGPFARSASVSRAIEKSDAVVFAVWLDAATSFVSHRQRRPS